MNGAEKAYRRAVEIAPDYTYPHWQIGNFYLRRNQSDEAFAELKKAAEKIRFIVIRFFQSLGIITKKTRQNSNKLLAIRLRSKLV